MNKTMKKPTAISVKNLHPFAGHPYKVLDNEEMDTLTESIQTQGILSPLIVRPMEGKENEYEVVSGHRRLHAAMKAGLETVPAFVYDLDHDTAAITLVDSNLHREHILPSEKAFAYRLKMEALAHQGKRTDLTSSQLETKLRTDEQIGKDANESRATVQRYIRLTNLIPELLGYMDAGRMALSVGVELSYLSEPCQRDLLELCEVNDCTPSYSQAFRIKNLYRDGRLTRDGLADIMNEEKANQRETLKISTDKLRGLLPQNLSVPEQEDFILKAVNYYRNYLQRQQRCKSDEMER